MNKVILIGRLTKDPDIRYSGSGEDAFATAHVNIAVDRRIKSKDGITADFPRCVAFGKTAEFLEKYFRQGMRIGITGRIQTGNYTDKNGNKVYTTEVIIDEAEFVESKKTEPANAENVGPAPSVDADAEFMNVPDNLEDSIPFK